MTDQSLARPVRNRWKRLLIWSARLIVLWLVVCFLFGYFATRRPHPLYAEPAPSLSWGKVQSLRLTTTDGEDLGAWFIPGRSDRPVVLLLHGHRGSRGNCLRQAEIFASSGCATLLVSLRTHGDSTGNFDDIGYSSRNDVAAAVAWLETNQPGRPIVIYGQSMGSGSAVFAAGLLGGRVKGYILESPYQDLRTALWNRITEFLPGVLGMVPYYGLLLVSPLVLPDLDKISPRDAATGIPASVPVLILAGRRDNRALPEEAEAIHDRIREHAQLIFLDGRHSNLHADDLGGYRGALVGFVDRIAH